ncbi:radical SAM protein [Candidatus Poribacteria bacterium]|nr:MAG: radical SAM protein [Candidatus Poribacteria bacterium]
MKVLLVNPPFPSGVYNALNMSLPPMGLMYVASVLREGGHDVKLVDLTVKGQKVDLSEPDIIGISGCTPQYPFGLELARRAKEEGKVVVMGGPHVTFTAEETLKTGLVDFVVRGEGEMTMLELVDALQGGRFDPSKIPGISWLDRETGRVVHNPDRPPVMDLDSLPYPARDLVGIRENYNTYLKRTKLSTPIITSRGCPFRCSFCVVPRMNGRIWRPRSPEAVVDEIEHVVEEYGFEGIIFTDDNFTVRPERVKRICDLIIERKIDIAWWCMSRADTILKNEDMVERMAEAGCCTIFIGFESPNPETLKFYHKKTSPDVNERAIELLRKHGIQTLGSFILGALNEGKEECERTIEYALRLDPEQCQFSILTPYPGTEIFDMVKDRIKVRDWTKYDCVHAVFDSDRLTARQKEKLLRKAYRRFYLRPRRIFNFSKIGPSAKTVWLILRYFFSQLRKGGKSLWKSCSSIYGR